VNAFLALDVAITGHGSVAATEIPYTQTTAPTAKQGLFDGTATGLQLDIHDGSATYVTGITYTSQANVATTMTPTGGAITVPNLLVNSAAISTGGTRHLVVNYSLPTTAGNAYNLATSSIVLRIHAVQADNNPLPTSPACVAGRQCDSPGMTWS
jgi:hypothetical protein